MVAVAAFAFGQAPRHLRVLNYVPDSCYSLTVMNLDTVARVMELESLHREHVLKVIYDSLSFSKKLVQSWLKRDSKLGVDFTASVAIANSRCFLLPLNSERNFEKTLRSLDKTVPPFETVTAPDGQKVRCTVLEDGGMGVAVICTGDVACVVMLNDMDALYSMALQNTAISDTADLDRLYETLYKRDDPMQLWARMSRSRFVESEIAKSMSSKGWSSYTAYNHRNSLMRLLGTALERFAAAPEEISRMVGQIDMEIFSRTEVRRDRFTMVSEVRQHAGQPGLSSLRRAPEKLDRLLPYMGGEHFLLAVGTGEGYGDLMKPYAELIPQMRGLWPLLNYPFVFAMNSTEEILFGTLVDEPGKVRGILERYVEESNRITDSTFRAQAEARKAQAEAEKEAFSKKMEEGDAYEEFETMGFPFGSAVDPEDSTVNMKTLSCKKIDDWDAYIVVTRKQEMDYETFTMVVKDDSACVLLKDGLLFYAESLGAMDVLSNPVEREWPREYFEHLFYAKADFNALVALLGPEAALPMRDMVMHADDNTFTLNVNAVPGLHHGLLYETLMFVMDFFRN